MSPQRTNNSREIGPACQRIHSRRTTAVSSIVILTICIYVLHIQLISYHSTCCSLIAEMSRPASRPTTRSGVAAAAPSSSSSGVSSSNVSIRPPLPGLDHAPLRPSTESPCTHTPELHVKLPHMDATFWSSLVRSFSPLASYYVEFILSSPRGCLPLEADRLAAEMGETLWEEHYVPPDTKAPPIFPTAKCIEFLQNIRHTKSQGRMSGKSLYHTLETKLHPLDRAHFLQVLLPYLSYLVLQLPTFFPLDGHCLPKLISGVDQAVTLSAGQCAAIFACQFFSLFPSSGPSWPTCNMDAFFSVSRPSQVGKHILMLNYVARIEDPRESIPSRFVTFHRRVLNDDSTSMFEDLSTSTIPLGSVEFHPTGSIEEATHALQADFANKYIGGGVLYSGCVQEEIRFCLSPECIVSMLLCESMSDNEAIALIGPGMYSTYKGYGSTLEFGSNLKDEGLELDEFKRKSNCIIAIDALDFCNNNDDPNDLLIQPEMQWKESFMEREILKAYVGFSFPQQELGQKFTYQSIATGNWGCGAFGGFIPLKFLLQWLSSSLSGRHLHYYAFEAPLACSIPMFLEQFQKEFQQLQQQDQSSSSSSSSSPSSLTSSSTSPVTVGEMWQALVQLAPKYQRQPIEELTSDGIFQELLQLLIQQRRRSKGSSATDNNDDADTLDAMSTDA